MALQIAWALQILNEETLIFVDWISFVIRHFFGTFFGKGTWSSSYFPELRHETCHYYKSFVSQCMAPFWHIFVQVYRKSSFSRMFFLAAVRQVLPVFFCLFCQKKIERRASFQYFDINWLVPRRLVPHGRFQTTSMADKFCFRTLFFHLFFFSCVPIFSRTVFPAKECSKSNCFWFFQVFRDFRVFYFGTYFFIILCFEQSLNENLILSDSFFQLRWRSSS